MFLNRSQRFFGFESNHRGVTRRPRWASCRRYNERKISFEQLEDRRLLSITAWTDENVGPAAEFKNPEALLADVNSALGIDSSTAEAPQFVPGEILVGFEGDVPAAYRAKGAAAALKAAGKLVGAHGLHSPEVLLELPAAANRPAWLATRWQLPAGADMFQTVARLASRPGIAYAEPNYLVSIDAMPDDPQFSQLWGMHNTGQTGGTADADIDALEAWDTGATGSHETIVGVVDTGVDYTHPDLYLNVWINQGEIPSDLFPSL